MRDTLDGIDNPWDSIDPDGRLRRILREQAKYAEAMRGALWATGLADSIRAAQAVPEDMRR
jgi:hypothetical protein